jgi:carboxypeptidase Taq
MKTKEDLEIIARYQKEIRLLSQTSGLLQWDQRTYMPKKAIKSRAEQTALLSSLIHEKFTSDEFFNAISRLKNKNLDEESTLIVRKLYKEISKSKKLPKEFIEELSKTSSIANKAWEEARERKDFSIFLPHLKKLIDLKRKQAKLIGLPGHIYNSLLDDFEEGMTVEKLTPVFQELKTNLISLIKKIKSSRDYNELKIEILEGKFPKELQMELAKDVAKAIGLEEDYSRIDFSEHPFSIKLGTNDGRITTNIRTDPLFCFGATMHESGHTLYELEIPEEYEYNIIGDAPSYGLHESQSRFWENMIGLSKPFWKYYFPKFKERFKIKEKFNEWYKEVNFVTPGLIRIEADEIHYCLHIILRFELEKALIEGSIQAESLPKLWNEKMKEFFGVEPKNDKDGVMQDIHWSEGCFGYFPSYAIGTIYAAQIYEALKKDIPDMEKDIEKGDYKKIKSWLKQKIHKHGAKFLAEDIIKEVCGEGLNPKVFIDYLNKKYLEMYNLK